MSTIYLFYLMKYDMYQNNMLYTLYTMTIRLTLPPHKPPSATVMTPITLTANVFNLINLGTLIPFKKHFTAGIPEPLAIGYQHKVY